MTKTQAIEIASMRLRVNVRNGQAMSLDSAYDAIAETMNHRSDAPALSGQAVLKAAKKGMI